MKKGLFYFVLIIAFIGLITNLDNVFNMIFNMALSLVIIGLILYAIYYYFLLSEDERKYRRALRKTKRKRKFRE
ncbi:SA1362 family protein [Nosocomiicoccus ampullae]|uniref:Ca2+/Na+ antiporter n=1 Tax=Nosocomiicoccus ampullae TaxID=489910 RepID=A0A9Q2D0I1_9STAP|nr:SA1362 family protein [Nosocomiicoccus ampullae]MBB5176416.1 Ca2+/Na+ antiporter [Nosocomiicoccus ampullae]QYA47604.1 hypothetical protein KPF49_03955 [Nosocomiicoccus ampullae]